MSEISEVLFTASKTMLQVWNCQSFGSLNSIHVYKSSGEILCNSLNFIKNDMVLTAQQDKPLLHVWPINGVDELKNPKFILPEPARTVQVSTDNCYLAAGINKKLYIWQISSGVLLTAQEIHLCPITCLKFSFYSDYLVVGATNGSVLVYRFSDLVSLHETSLVQERLGQIKPLYNLIDHTNAIGDIFIEQFPKSPRFVTVSFDNSCRVYDLISGVALLQLICEQPLTTVALDATSWNMFLGTSTGTILQFLLTSPPRTLLHHLNTTEEQLCFVGHTNRVNCMDINISGEVLVSGSDDFVVLVWNINSRQILNKLEQKSSITNVKYVMSKDLFDPHYKPKCILQELQRTMIDNIKKFEVSIYQDQDIVFSEDEESNSSDGEKEYAKLSAEIEELPSESVQHLEMCLKRLKNNVKL